MQASIYSKCRQSIVVPFIVGNIIPSRIKIPSFYESLSSLTQFYLPLFNSSFSEEKTLPKPVKEQSFAYAQTVKQFQRAQKIVKLNSPEGCVCTLSR